MESVLHAIARQVAVAIQATAALVIAVASVRAKTRGGDAHGRYA